jgi:hypothetical protein
MVALYDLDTMHARTLAELKTWYKFARNRNTAKARCEFTSAILEPYIRHAVIDRLETATPDSDLSEVIIDALDSEPIKTKRAYRRKVRSIFFQYWQDNISISDALSRMTALIEQQFTQAFRRGVKRGGLSYNDLSPDEQVELDILISEEKSHVLKLLRDFSTDKRDDDVSLDKYRQRAELWIARYDRVEERGFVIAARNAKLTWRRNPAKESCVSCIALDGTTKRASDWKEFGVEPKSPRLACFGGYCGCTLEITDADTPLSKGSIPRVGLRAG